MVKMVLASLAVFLLLLATAVARCPSQLGEGEHEVTINVNGVDREFFIFVPPGVGVHDLLPGNIMLHGCGSSPEKFELESGMNAYATEAKYYNVYMKGTTTGTRLGWNAGFSTCQTDKGTNDAAFTKEVVIYLFEHLCIDANRIFATGFSNGGSMVFNLTCQERLLFAGFAFAGSTMPPSIFPQNPACDGGVPPEQVNPILGLCGSKDGCASSMASWFNEYSAGSGCVRDAVETKLSSTSTCWKKNDCGIDKSNAVEYCMVEGLGHCWSGNDCCDQQCLNQDPDNMKFSKHVLDFFTDVKVVRANRTYDEVIASLRRY